MNLAAAALPGGRFVAFDTSTDRMSIAVSRPSGAADGAVEVWQHDGPGAAQSSATLIPQVMQLLADSGQALADLDALVFGRGPGSFTGLRTACAVAQGLALGAHLPVIAIDTLLAVAEEARFAKQLTQALYVTAALDARMNELYVQDYAYASGVWTALGACVLTSSEALHLRPAAGMPHLLAGNVFTAYQDRLPPLPAHVAPVEALPTATAMLRLAPALLAAGAGLPAAQALPLYIRDKVAFTTSERDQAKSAAEARRLAELGTAI